MASLLTASDGRARCAWVGDDAEYRRYHDEEWGHPLHGDRALFEKMALEGFQAGLSWITILRKRPRFREVFAGFEREPVASASIAQVHFAVLRSGPFAGREAAVKVLRPGMQAASDEDLALLEAGALLVEKLWRAGKRLRPREVVAEFDKYLHDELDLMREAANASQLRRNFAGSRELRVPEMYWDYCCGNVIVMVMWRSECRFLEV